METQRKGRKQKRKPEEDFELYKEYLRIPNGKKAEFMRKHGLYPAEIARMEETIRNGALKALGERKKRKKERLYTETELRQKDERIHELEGTLADTVTENRVLKKKVNGV